MLAPGMAGSTFAIGASDVEIERDERGWEPRRRRREAFRAGADEGVSEGHLPRVAAGSEGA